MIYNKIKQIRESRNITVDTIAFEMNISIVNYIAIESGEIDLKLSKLLKISEILEIQPRDLFDDFLA